MGRENYWLEEDTWRTSNSSTGSLKAIGPPMYLLDHGRHRYWGGSTSVGAQYYDPHVIDLKPSHLINSNTTLCVRMNPRHKHGVHIKVLEPSTYAIEASKIMFSAWISVEFSRFWWFWVPLETNLCKIMRDVLTFFL